MTEEGNLCEIGSENTKKRIKTWLNAYRKWATLNGKNENLEEYQPVELNTILCQFYREVRKKDGSDYEPVCLRVMQSSIYRYLSDKNYPKSLLTGNEFEESNKILEHKMHELQTHSRKRKRPAEYDEFLWESGKLGKTSPMILLHTMWFLISQYFGIRGRERHSVLVMEDFVRCFDHNSGKRFIQIVEDPSREGHGRMFETGGERCPVAHFEFYVSKRPVLLRTTGRVYLAPRKSYEEHGPWFSNSHYGKNKIGPIMKEMLADTPFENCGRKFPHFITNNLPRIYGGRNSGKESAIQPQEIPTTSSHEEPNPVVVLGYCSDSNLKRTIPPPTSPPPPLIPTQYHCKCCIERKEKIYKNASVQTTTDFRHLVGTKEYDEGIPAGPEGKSSKIKNIGNTIRAPQTAIQSVVQELRERRLPENFPTTNNIKTPIGNRQQEKAERDEIWIKLEPD